ncbi:MAG: hypothetical protein HFJ28_02025 [Clostridia bacterium]|nr:hypothetical protein [Clostridia bacterium]
MKAGNLFIILNITNELYLSNDGVKEYTDQVLRAKQFKSQAEASLYVRSEFTQEAQKEFVVKKLVLTVIDS